MQAYHSSQGQLQIGDDCNCLTSTFPGVFNDFDRDQKVEFWMTGK